MTPYEDKTFKDTLQEEKNKLKTMNLKDRLWYIWEYYKLPIIGTVVAVTLIISIFSAVRSNSFETALSCVILNSHTTSQEDLAGEYFDQGFRQYLGLTDDTKIDVDHSMTVSFDNSDMTEFTYAELAKLSALITSKELDVMIGRKDSIDHFGEMGGFLDLKQVLPPDVYEKVKDQLYEVTNQETGETIACGIRVGSTDFLKKTGLDMDDPILGIISNSTRTDNAVKLIRYVFGMQAENPDSPKV